MFKIARKIRRIVQRTDNSWSILITGPSGSGKGLIARTIHAEMERKAQCNLPFVEVNCGAMLETTANSDLLGRVRGAFTGADKDQPGHLENAGSGVFFLDDIQHLQKGEHGKFLSALQEGTFQRVGTSKRTAFKARAVSSANVDLGELERRGQMEEEFYNRIARDMIAIPPLFQRPRDIEPLMHYFLSKYQSKPTRMPRDYGADVIRAFQAYTWPGDIRQLENAVRSICTHLVQEVVTLDMLKGLDLRHKGRPIDWDTTPADQQDSDFLLSRVGWHSGWSKIAESEFDQTANWLKQLWPRQTTLIDDLSAQVKSHRSPKGIHFLKALLFMTLVDGNRATHKEIEKVIQLGWDFTNRVLCFLAGEEYDGRAGFHAPPLSKSQEGAKWTYRLSPSLGQEATGK